MRAGKELQKDNRMKSKLHSEDGASLALALLFFILCAVVGSVILTAATAAMGRMANTDDSERAKYAVSAAAKLIRQEMKGTTFTAVADNYADPVPRGSLTADRAGETVDASRGISQLHRVLAQKLLEKQWSQIKALNNGSAGSVPRSSQEDTNVITWNGTEEQDITSGTVTLTVRATEAEIDNLPQVTAELHMNGRGEITVVLKTSQGLSSATKEIRIPAEPATVRFDEMADGEETNEDADPKSKIRVTYTMGW